MVVIVIVVVFVDDIYDNDKCSGLQGHRCSNYSRFEELTPSPLWQWFVPGVSEERCASIFKMTKRRSAGC